MYSTFDVLGTLCIIYVMYKIFSFVIRVLYNNFLAVFLRINAVNFKDLGKWAVVTGATDGIGEAYAERLAKLGKNIVLISRNPVKLENVANRLATTYRIETKIITADFRDVNEIYHEIDKQLLGLDIGILVNNVGMSYPHPDYFLELKDGDEIYRNIIFCNIFSVTYMTKLVLPIMTERKRGVVINVSSVTAQIPSPLLSVYAASKAYVDKFSQDISTEYAQYNIIVQCILPGFVTTKMSKIRSSTWMAPTPSKYVSEALKTVGVFERTTGYFPHTLLVAVIRILQGISMKLSRWIVMNIMEKIRLRATRKNIE